jgi:hypothetical protein
MRSQPWVMAVILAGCGSGFDPAWYVQDLRVLAVKAEPPEVAPGQTTTLTALVADPSGAAIEVTWAACTTPASPGRGPISPECFNEAAGPHLVPLGSGISIVAPIPALSPERFLPADASGGVYLPVVLDARAAERQVDAAFRVRLSRGGLPNRNPVLDGVFVVTAAGLTPLPPDDAAPFEVQAGEQVTLRATFADGSDEAYEIVVPGQTRPATELLRVSWFATGGSLSEPVTGQARPDTVWRGDERLPTPGTPIDLYVVARDERGGADFMHRRLLLR